MGLLCDGPLLAEPWAAMTSARRALLEGAARTFSDANFLPPPSILHRLMLRSMFGCLLWLTFLSGFKVGLYHHLRRRIIFNISPRGGVRIVRSALQAARLSSFCARAHAPCQLTRALRRRRCDGSKGRSECALRWASPAKIALKAPELRSACAFEALHAKRKLLGPPALFLRDVRHTCACEALICSTQEGALCAACARCA